MEEKDMNEFSQIRERFLANTRQHFFAADSSAKMMQSATRQNSNSCHSGTDVQRSGKAGA